MPSSRRAFLTLAGSSLTAVALSACTPQQPAAPATTTAAPPSTTPGTDLESVFANAFEATGMAGCAIRVRHEGAVWESTAGVSDRTTGAAYSAGDYVRIASITKTFTATVVLQLVDDGLLRLDDPLERFIPGVANGAEITIRHLLGMRSGMFNFPADPQFLEQFEADPAMHWSLDQTLEVIRRNEPLFAPGERVEYCDSNFYLLGAIAEQVGAAPLDELVVQRVITPLGLTTTIFPTDAALPTPHPTPYVPATAPDGSIDPSVEPRVVVEVDPSVSGGAGAMISTLGDLAAWGDELVDGTLLSAETQRERLATERFTGMGFDLGYGLGIMNLNEYLGHNGAIFGFSSVVLTRPQTGTQIAVVGNESTNESSSTLDIAMHVIAAIDPSQGPGA